MKKIFLICSLAIMFVLGSCVGTIVLAEQNNPVKIWGENTNGPYHTLVVIDENTNVNYIVVATNRGNGEYAISITPRLNADGSLYTSR